MNKEIIAFIGRAGSGKDYQCNLLIEKGFKQIAFADALRDIAFSSLKIDVEEGMKYYDWFKSTNCITISSNSVRSINFRQFLEYLGTQGIRKYDNDFWCRCLVKQLQENNYEKVCISDMRFLNEYNYIDKFAKINDYEFKVIFCDYRSNRYQENNTHQSAIMGNWFATHGYKDLQEITQSDMYKFRDEIKE